MTHPAEVLQLRSDQASDLGRYDLAKQLASQAIAADPFAGDNYASLGRACLGLNDVAAAESAFRHALRIDADNQWYLLGLSVCLRISGRYPEALETIDQALAIEPDFSPNHYERGRCLEKLSLLTQAETAFERAISLDPDSPVPYQFHATFLMAQERWADAERSYRQALRLQPTDTAALNNLGVVLDRQGRTEEAMRCYQQAFDLDPNLAVAKSNTVDSVDRLLSGPAIVTMFSLSLLGASVALILEHWGKPAGNAGLACLTIVAAIWLVSLRKRSSTKNQLGKTDSKVLQTYERIKKHG